MEEEKKEQEQQNPDSCSHDCGSCSSDCGSRKGGKEGFREEPHDMSSIGHVIAVVSGKGGVGKSLVTSLMAIAMQKKGYHAAILDADITGPSIPTAFGLHERAKMTEFGLLPTPSRTGIDIMSLNLILEHEDDPVVWRGPIIAGAVKQFWTDVIWSDVDYLFVDMPPGTGDVPLTVFQSLPVEGVIIVASPQDLVSMIVGKAVRMAEMMHIPVIGLVENMAWFTCPDCGSRHYLFGQGKGTELALRFSIPVVAELPIDPAIAECVDQGNIEDYPGDYLDALADFLETVTKEEEGKG